MEALIDLSWRTYPATALAVAGLLPALQGGRRLWRGFRPPYADPAKTLDGVQGFRRGIIGLALAGVAGVAGAWIWQLDWLLALSLVIGAEEVLESSLHVRALRMSRDHYRRTRDATTTRPAPAAEEHASPRQHGLSQPGSARHREDSLIATMTRPVAIIAPTATVRRIFAAPFALADIHARLRYPPLPRRDA